MNGNEIDMRMFAQRAGASVSYAAGSIVFNKNDGFTASLLNIALG